MSHGAACPDEPPTEANQYQTRCTASGLTPIQPDGSLARICSTDVQKHAAWCMIRARLRMPIITGSLRTCSFARANLVLTSVSKMAPLA
jgi:hypothetical protein